jgi:purine-binding chemotaxis protein CheW
MSSDNLVNWRNEILDLLDGDVAVPQSETVAPVEGASDRTEVLAFSLGEEIFGVDIRRVAEILRYRMVTRLPRVPDFVMGVVSLRGSILPVADTAVRIGLEKREESELTRIVVINDGEEKMGFSVDSVIGVVRFSEGELKTVEFASGVDTEYLLSIGYDSRQRLIALLSAERLCDFSLEDYQ